MLTRTHAHAIYLIYAAAFIIISVFLAYMDVRW